MEDKNTKTSDSICTLGSGFQVAYISQLARHVLANAIQQPMLRVDLVQQAIERLELPDSHELHGLVRELKSDIIRVSRSYAVKED